MVCEVSWVRVSVGSCSFFSPVTCELRQFFVAYECDMKLLTGLFDSFRHNTGILDICMKKLDIEKKILTKCLLCEL